MSSYYCSTAFVRKVKITKKKEQIGCNLSCSCYFRLVVFVIGILSCTHFIYFRLSRKTKVIWNILNNIDLKNYCLINQKMGYWNQSTAIFGAFD